MMPAFQTAVEFCAIGLAIYALHLCVILVHEAGHAVAARMLGFECSRICVGPFSFDRKDGFAIRFRWNEFLTGSVLAQFRSVPGARAVMRAFGTFCAGPIFSLLFSFLASVLAPSRGVSSELAGLVILDSVLIGVLTLVPARNGIRTTDGYKI
jgi:hypothetical protein